MGKVNTSVLTDKQILFCKEYIISLNASDSAKKAGYSIKTVGAIGFENLKKPEIQKYIEFLMKERSEKLGVDAEMVLQELKKIGFSDIGEFFNDGYSIKSISDLKENSRVIASIQVDDTVSEFGNSRSVKFKLHDKLLALEKIAKHIGFFEKDNKQQNPEPLPPPTAKEIKEISDKLENEC